MGGFSWSTACGTEGEWCTAPGQAVRWGKTRRPHGGGEPHDLRSGTATGNPVGTPGDQKTAHPSSSRGGHPREGGKANRQADTGAYKQSSASTATTGTDTRMQGCRSRQLKGAVSTTLVPVSAVCAGDGYTTADTGTGVTWIVLRGEGTVARSWVS